MGVFILNTTAYFQMVRYKSFYYLVIQFKDFNNFRHIFQCEFFDVNFIRQLGKDDFACPQTLFWVNANGFLFASCIDRLLPKGHKLIVHINGLVKLVAAAISSAVGNLNTML